MFVYIRARFSFLLISGNLTAQSTGSHRGIGGVNQIPETFLQAVLLFPAPLPVRPRRTCSQATSLTWKQLVFLFFVCLFFLICSALFLWTLDLPLLVRERVSVFFRSLNQTNCFCLFVCVHRKNYKMIVWRKPIGTQDLLHVIRIYRSEARTLRLTSCSR